MRALLAVLLFAGTVAAQTPSIRMIQPNLVPAKGEKGVTILTDASFGACRIDFCGITLRIGGIDIDPTSVFVVGSQMNAYFSEPFPPGPADVEIRTPTATMRAPGAITFVAPDEYETVLLPHTPGSALQGANGSDWRVELLLHNESPYSLRFDAPMFPYTLISPPPPDWFIVPPQTTANVTLFTGNGPLRLRLPSSAIDDLTFETRFYDQSRAGANFGTRVPTVRERDFRHGLTTIPGIPLGSTFRSTVRIFSPDGVPRDFHVRILTQSELTPQPWDVPPIQPVPSGLIVTYVVRTEMTEFKSGPWEVPMVSVPLGGLSGNSRIQVQIQPLEDAPYWAYVSLTNNETQQVTLLTP